MNGKTTHEKQKHQFFRGMAILLLLFICTNLLFAQEKTITGRVTDNNGESIPGVHVLVKGTLIGTVSDIDGNFTLNVPNESAILEFSLIGYAAQEIVVGTQTNIDVKLEEGIREIDQVVVIGYGTQKKSDLTGSVASITSEELKSVPVGRLDEALEGRAAGVNVSATSGMPGASRVITIRGNNSINGSNPLVVIDGIPVVSDNPASQMNSISPGDIQSIEVLKDAASTAIYGALGGNGVILITTKKGKEGKITTSVNTYTGFQDIPKKIDMMDTRQWNQFYAAKNGRPYINSEDSLNMNYDWQDGVYDIAPMKNIEINISGGTEKSNFSVGANYMTQEGVLKNTGYDKFLMSLNSEHKLTKWMRFDEKVRFSYDKTTGPGEWQYQNVYNNFTSLPALTMVPFLEPYDSSGKWSISPVGGRNPFTGIDMRSDQFIKNIGIHGNFGLTLDLLKGLTFTSRFSTSINNAESWNWQPEYYSWSEDENPLSRLDQTWTKYYSWTFQNYITYNTTIHDNHNLSVMIAMEAANWWDYNIGGYRLDFPSSNPDLLYFYNSIDNSTAAQKINGIGKEATSQGYFGRLNYNYRSLLLFQFNARRDGQSNFGPNFKWGNFYSGSAGFKFSELEVIKNLGIFSFGKFRVGYGETGQYPVSTYWPYASSILNAAVMNYSFDNQTIIAGLGPVQVPNPDLHWETVKTTNIGLDLGFMKDQLNITIEYFNKINEGMIMPQAVPSLAGTYLLVSGNQPAELGSTGITSTYPLVNYGSVSNKGLEASIDFKRQIGDIKVDLGLNFTYLKNEIIDLAIDSTINPISVHDLTGLTISKVGQPIGTFRGYQFDGIFKEGDPMVYNSRQRRYVFADQPYTINAATGDTTYARPFAKPGDAKWVDVNKDGKWDTQDYVYLGSYNPKFVYGFTIGMEYKGFDFSMFFQGVYGNEVYNGVKRWLYDWQTLTNHRADFADRYHLPVVYNNDTIDPGNLTSGLPEMGGANWGTSSSLYVESGSYLRLRTLTLGYTLPNVWTNKIGLQKFRIYFTGKNLLTFTKYSGYDPEVANTDPKIAGIDIAGYPQSKMYIFGLSFEF